MKNITDFEDILIGTYGKKGTEKRDKYDADSLAFRLGVSSHTKPDYSYTRPLATSKKNRDKIKIT